MAVMKAKASPKPQKNLSRKDTIKFIDEEIARLKSNATVENANSFLRKLSAIRKAAKAIEYGEGIVESYQVSGGIKWIQAGGISEASTNDFQTALTLAEKLSFRKGIAHAKMTLIRVQDMAGGDSTELIYATSEVLLLARKEKDTRLEWRALKFLASNITAMGEISRGYALFEEALAIAEKTGIIVDIVATITDASSTLIAPALYEEHLRRAAELAASGDIPAQAKSFAYIKYAAVLHALKRYPACEAYINRVRELFPMLGPVHEGEMRASIGSYYLERGLVDVAREEFRYAIELGMYSKTALYVYAEMGRMHAQSEPQKALYYFEEGLRFANLDNGLGDAHLLHGYLAEFYLSIGEPEKASQQYALYKSITEDSKKKEDKQRADYAEMILRFDQSQKHEKELAEEVEEKSAALASKAMLLAEQTELLSNFRNDLRAILRKVEVNDPAINEIRKKLRELPEAVNWREFDEQFQSVHPGFQTMLSENYPALSKMELKNCVLLRLGLNSLDISKLLSLSKRTTEWHRHNIRKKLGIKPAGDVVQFLQRM